jgi:hypothetical protein
LDLDRLGGVQACPARHPLVRGPDLRIDLVRRNHPIAVLVELAGEAVEKLGAITARRLGLHRGSHEQQHHQSEKDMPRFHRSPLRRQAGTLVLSYTMIIAAAMINTLIA